MKTLDMTKGSPIKLILQFAVPLFIGALLQQLYNFTDTMIVGRCLGDKAVAAVGATSALYSVLINFANGMNNGYGIIISRVFGAKDDRELRKTASAMLVLNAVVTLALTAFILPLLKPLLFWLETPGEIFEQAHRYILIIVGGMVTTIGYNMGAGFMRAVGNSRTPLYFLMLSCGLNVVFDLLFVAVFSLGVAGAAGATVLAQLISALLCFVYIYRNYQHFLPGKGDWRMQAKRVKDMLFTGLSMGLMLSLFSIGSIILQKGINQLGTQIITAHTASRRIYELLMMPLSMMASAASIFTGQNFGAKKYQRIRTAIRQVMEVEVVYVVIAICLAYTLGGPLVYLLIGTEDLVIMDNATLYLRVCTLFFFPLSVLLLIRNAIQPMGCKISPVLSSAIELLMKIFFCFMVIPRVGYLGVVFTEPVIWTICAAFLGVIYLRFQKKMTEREENTNEEKKHKTVLTGKE